MPVSKKRQIVSSSSESDTDPKDEGGCSAIALTHIGVFDTVDLAKEKLNAMMKHPEDGIPNEEWHVETIKRAICKAGWHFKKLKINPGNTRCVDLTKEFQQGSYFCIGISNNFWHNENDKPQRLKFPDYSDQHPAKKPREWMHAIAIKNSYVYDSSTTKRTKLGSLWIDENNNQPDKDRGIMRSFNKVWRVYKCKCVDKQNKECKGECRNFSPALLNEEKPVDSKKPKYESIHYNFDFQSFESNVENLDSYLLANHYNWAINCNPPVIRIRGGGVTREDGKVSNDSESDADSIADLDSPNSKKRQTVFDLDSPYSKKRRTVSGSVSCLGSLKSAQQRTSGPSQQRISGPKRMMPTRKVKSSKCTTISPSFDSDDSQSDAATEYVPGKVYKKISNKNRKPNKKTDDANVTSAYVRKCVAQQFPEFVSRDKNMISEFDLLADAAQKLLPPSLEEEACKNNQMKSICSALKNVIPQWSFTQLLLGWSTKKRHSYINELINCTYACVNQFQGLHITDFFFHYRKLVIRPPNVRNKLGKTKFSYVSITDPQFENMVDKLDYVSRILFMKVKTSNISTFTRIRNASVHGEYSTLIPAIAGGKITLEQQKQGVPLGTVASPPPFMNHNSESDSQHSQQDDDSDSEKQKRGVPLDVLVSSQPTESNKNLDSSFNSNEDDKSDSQLDSKHGPDSVYRTLPDGIRLHKSFFSDSEDDASDLEPNKPLIIDDSSDGNPITDSGGCYKVGSKPQTGLNMPATFRFKINSKIQHASIGFFLYRYIFKKKVNSTSLYLDQGLKMKYSDSRIFQFFLNSMAGQKTRPMYLTVLFHLCLVFCDTNVIDTGHNDLLDRVVQVGKESTLVDEVEAIGGFFDEVRLRELIKSAYKKVEQLKYTFTINNKTLKHDKQTQAMREKGFQGVRANVFELYLKLGRGEPTRFLCFGPKPGKKKKKNCQTNSKKKTTTTHSNSSTECRLPSMELPSIADLLEETDPTANVLNSISDSDSASTFKKKSDLDSHSPSEGNNSLDFTTETHNYESPDSQKESDLDSRSNKSTNLNCMEAGLNSETAMNAGPANSLFTRSAKQALIDLYDTVNDLESTTGDIPSFLNANRGLSSSATKALSDFVSSVNTFSDSKSTLDRTPTSAIATSDSVTNAVIKSANAIYDSIYSINHSRQSIIDANCYFPDSAIASLKDFTRFAISQFVLLESTIMEAVPFLKSFNHDSALDLGADSCLDSRPDSGSSYDRIISEMGELKIASADTLKKMVSSTLRVKTTKQNYDLELNRMELYVASMLRRNDHYRCTSLQQNSTLTRIGTTTTIPSNEKQFLDPNDVLSVIRPGSGIWNQYQAQLRFDTGSIVKFVQEFGKPDTRRREACSSRSVEFGVHGELPQNETNRGKLYGHQHFHDPRTNTARTSLSQIIDFMWDCSQQMQAQNYKPSLGGNKIRRSRYADQLRALFGCTVMEFESITVVVSILHPYAAGCKKHLDRKNDIFYSYNKTVCFETVLTDKNSNYLIHLQVLGNFRASCLNDIDKTSKERLEQLERDLSKYHKLLRNQYQQISNKFDNGFLRQSHCYDIYNLDSICLHDGLPWVEEQIHGSCKIITYQKPSDIPKNAVVCEVPSDHKPPKSKNEEDHVKDNNGRGVIIKDRDLKVGERVYLKFFQSRYDIPVGVSRTFSFSMILDKLAVCSTKLATDQMVELCFFGSFLSSQGVFSEVLTRMLETEDSRLLNSVHPLYGVWEEWHSMFHSHNSGKLPRYSASSKRITDLIEEENDDKMAAVCSELFKWIEWIDDQKGKSEAHEIPAHTIKAEMKKVCLAVQSASGLSNFDFGYFRLSIFTTIISSLGIVQPGRHLQQIFIPVKGSASLEHMLSPLADEDKKIHDPGPEQLDEEFRYLSQFMGFRRYRRDIMEVLVCESKLKRQLSIRDPFRYGQRLFWMNDWGSPMVKNFGENQHWCLLKIPRKSFKFLNRSS